MQEGNVGVIKKNWNWYLVKYGIVTDYWCCCFCAIDTKCFMLAYEFVMGKMLLITLIEQNLSKETRNINLITVKIKTKEEVCQFFCLSQVYNLSFFVCSVSFSLNLFFVFIVCSVNFEITVVFVLKIQILQQCSNYRNHNKKHQNR